jgi:exopolysaccharide biosynthesis polyprenyl glycosylphosphotransferase
MSRTANQQVGTVDSDSTSAQTAPRAVERGEAPIAVSLHASATRNIRRHWLWDIRRVAVLAASDLAVFALLRIAVNELRSGLLLPAPMALEVRSLLPQGFLGGWQFAVALLLSLTIVGAYGADDRWRDVGRLLAGSALAAGLSLYFLVWQQNLALVLTQFALTTAAFWVALAAERTAIDQVLRRLVPRVVGRRVVVVCDTGHGWVEANLRSNGRGGRTGALQVVARVMSSGHGGNGQHRPIEDLAAVIEEERADTVIVCGHIPPDQFAFVVDIALVSGCNLLAVSRLGGLARVEPKAVWLDGIPLIELTAPNLKAWQLVAKRTVDILGATLGLVLFGPILLVIALWVRRDSPGPALFGQLRLGAKGRLFRCYKFRSMRQDAEELLQSDPDLYRLYITNDYKLPVHHDRRITRAGSFLRKTSLDELPQFINVLKGDMSLVGPRPIVPSELEHYEHHAPLFLSLKPGMTGAWAVSGRSAVGYPDRAGVELEYIRKWSLLSDLGILARTVPTVLRSRGAH